MNNYTIFARDETRIPLFENMDCIVVGTVDILSANGTFKKKLTIADEWLHWLHPFIFTILFDIDLAITAYLEMIVIAPGNVRQLIVICVFILSMVLFILLLKNQTILLAFVLKVLSFVLQIAISE